MPRLIITLIATIAILASASNSQAGRPSTNGHPDPGRRPHHTVFRHDAVSKTGSGAPRAQSVKAPGAAIGVAGQAAAGGNSNPLLNKKKKKKEWL